MNAVVSPGRLAGTVRVPASKSAAHRALICAALADAPTRVRISAMNRDIEATMACLRALGAEIAAEGDLWTITPAARIPDAVELDCGESGSTLRFLLPVVCALNASARVVGHGRLPLRPNAALTDALRKHGAAVDSDLLPMNLSGPIAGGVWTLPGNVSSQYITGLLFALPLLKGDSEIALTTKLESAAYVDMTLDALRQFGIAVEPTDTGWRVPGGQLYHSPGELEVEGDWSAAAFWLTAKALGADVQITGLRDDTAQGDRAALALLGQAKIDANNVPDLVPALAVAAANLPQKTHITGAARLRLKESDRLETVRAMLAALGHRCEVTPDGLNIEGGPPTPCEADTRTVDGANDHRIVMAAAVAAAFADRPVRILSAEAVEKSYPDFFRDFTELGGRVHVEHPGQ
ncbi:MAG: 3-phosphoshikimate 1-carboxyvinyltransferase [Clostridia bacterium]|nr:3-phosphoshikimate 1-carboxyvinyltransferase [Clostridia bacterium]